MGREQSFGMWGQERLFSNELYHDVTGMDTMKTEKKSDDVKKQGMAAGAESSS